MAWSAQKNQIFFERARNWAAAVVNLLEERDRLIDLHANEANGDPAFVDTEIATVTELVALATNVMNPLNALINNGAPPAQDDRMEFLTPFLADQQ